MDRRISLDPLKTNDVLNLRRVANEGDENDKILARVLFSLADEVFAIKRKAAEELGTDAATT